MSLKLSRAFVCRLGAPEVDRVDPRIFQFRYFAHCMDCTFCHDACCQYGADIEMPRVRMLEKYQSELEAYLQVPRSEWFREDPEDIGILDEADYPGGQYTRTAVVTLPKARSPHNEEACVFLDPEGRGCRLHRFALERGIPVQDVKPLVCMMFPVLFAAGELIPACEFEIEDLVCSGTGPTLYRASRTDIEYYFGSELVQELDQLEGTMPQPEAETSTRTIPLPVNS